MSADKPEPERPNPERRSDSALLCFSIGVALVVLAWFLGVGGVLTAVLSGGAPAAVAGGLAALILLPLTAIAGLVMALIGMIWLVFRVIVDQREAHANERYHDVER